jgi:TonB family protein
MQQAKWALFAMFFVISTACLGQQTMTDMSDIPEGPSSTAHVRDPHSNSADLAVPLCPAKFDHSLATDGIASRFRDEGVRSPALKHPFEPSLSDEARSKEAPGEPLDLVVVVSLVVSTHGKPQDVCLVQSAGYGLDAKAAKAVQQIRFVPATKDGKPVAALVHFHMEFKLF